MSGIRNESGGDAYI
ncbi:Protein of unknown function [Bacillus cereus]|nr:Protein of unknown function [Bacillus cereus]SCV24078.1 Protein of unknown function [Bacillus wiedmannii]